MLATAVTGDQVETFLERRRGEVALAMLAFSQFLDENDMLAYLSMMAPRLVEPRRVLKPSGSIYLHCDPTASHYLKMLLGSIFDPRNFRNEIVWKRTTAHSDSKQNSKHYGRTHDILLFCSHASKDELLWNQQYTPHDPEYIESHYRHIDPDGPRYRWDNLTGQEEPPRITHTMRFLVLRGSGVTARNGWLNSLKRAL